MWNGSAPDEKLLTKGEVALLCRVEIRTVDRWVTSGKLRHYRTPGGRLLFVNADESSPVAAYITINDPVGDAERIRGAVQEGFLVRTALQGTDCLPPFGLQPWTGPTSPRKTNGFFRSCRRRWRRRSQFETAPRT